jgi:integrase/recombinase XerD
MSALAGSLQTWFTERLVRERNASPHTIASYRDTIRLLLIYASQRLGVEPSSLDLGQLDAPLIGAFLDHLETDRGCGARTAPDRSTWTGRRDHAIIILLAQTGLRASELTGLHCADIHLGTGAHATTTGKGRKQRITPLTKDTTAVLRAWLAERGSPPAEPLFPTSTGKPLTRKALARRIAKHAAHATERCPSLTAKTITPHVLRHTAAMRLLHAGVDTTVIALWPGHYAGDRVKRSVQKPRNRGHRS